jgi:tyrosine-protein kinase
MSTTSQDSTNSDNEYFRIIKEQQDEDERKHLRYNKNSTHRPNYFIPRQNLVMEMEIGKGEFGSVYKGVLRSSQLFDVSEDNDANVDLPVAIKTLLDEHSRENRIGFLREASVMIKLRHPCIVKLIGVSKDPTLMMVEELVQFGSMLEYIVKNASQINPNNELNIWASQIASGKLDY